jgi:clamp loader A subunit
MAKTLFEHLNAVFTNQSKNYFDSLEDSDKKSFNVYMINRLVSMAPDFLEIAAQFARYFEVVGPRETYLFYSQALPKGKRFDKYIKADKSDKYEPWLIETVARFFSVSEAEAINYCQIFYQTPAGKADLKRLCEKFGIDPKHIKKAKLG